MGESIKRSRTDLEAEDDGESQAKLRALAMLRMKQQQEPVQAEHSAAQPELKAEEEDESNVKKKALALLRMQQQQQVQPSKDPVNEHHAVLPSPAATTSIPDGTEGDGQAYESDEDVETWAADHDHRDLHQFEAEGQDFNHELQADEQHWEHESFARSLPPGWAKCPNSGKLLMDMLPIKAPYGGPKGQRVPAVYQWKPSDVYEHVTDQHSKRLGAVIDLTMSEKYYKPDEFQRLNVQYIKIPCKGHGETPSPKEVNSFIWAVQFVRGQMQALWEAEKKLLRKYELDVQEYDKQKAEAQAEQKEFPGKHPFMKLTKLDKDVVEKKDLVLKGGPRIVVIHCTHGFNRSGFMFCHYMKRFGPSLSVAACVKAFENARPPGMYKDEYIQTLFNYYHEQRDDAQTLTPMLPVWKVENGDDSPEHFDDNAPGATSMAGSTTEMKHDDKVGEEISAEEADMYRREVVKQIRTAFLHLNPAPGEEDGMSHQDVEKLKRANMRVDFPGSQPVSLSSSNQDLIYKHRYWFSWKADGTRYMMYISNSGTYLIDRRMMVTRVQMRFPLWLRQGIDTEDMSKWMQRFMQGKLERPSRVHPTQSRLHHGTLVDGEMVVNTLPDGTQQRVFYMYDLMMLNGANVVGLPWKSRYMLLTTEVVDSRNEERKRRDAEDKDIKKREEAMKKQLALQQLQRASEGNSSSGAAAVTKTDPIERQWTYNYEEEPFRVEGKRFWPLHDLEACRKNYFKSLAHENDGLILQAYQARYVPDACQMLLKWKPSSHNSVDFMLLKSDHSLVVCSESCEQALTEGQEWFLGVYGGDKVQLAFDLDHSKLKKLSATDPLHYALTQTPARIEFPSGENPEDYDGLVVECNFDSDNHTWCFMRDRTKDKDYPNGANTYMRVVKSIVSAINDDEITEHFQLAYKLAQDKYKKDILALQHALRR